MTEAAHVSGQEGIDDTLTITKRYTSLVILPIEGRIRRIGPYQVIEESVVGHVCRPLNPPDIIHTLQTGTQSAVDTKDLAGDDGGDGEGVEHVDKGFPDLDVCPPFAFVVETVH